MNLDYVNILTLLDIDSEIFYVTGLVIEGINAKLQICTKIPESIYCKECKKQIKPLVKDYYIRTIKSNILKNYKLTLEVRQARFKCPICGKTFTMDIKLAERKRRISNVAIRGILDSLATTQTLAEIAKNYNVGISTIFKFMDNFIKVPKRKPLPQILCIDEFHFRYDDVNGKYPSVISDYLTGEVIDIIPSRRKKILFSYFSKIPEFERKKVKYFVSDMNETFRTIRKAFFHEARHVIDLFHIMELFTRAIQNIRKQIMEKYKDEENMQEYKFLKDNWKLFNMHQDKLKEISKVDDATGVVFDLRAQLNMVLKRYDKLNAVYQAYEEFYRVTKKEKIAWNEAVNYIEYFIKQFTNSAYPELVSIGNSFKNWEWELKVTLTTSEYGKRLSNAVAEGNNNFIQTYIDACYGIKLFENLRKRIMLISEKKKLEA